MYKDDFIYGKILFKKWRIYNFFVCWDFGLGLIVFFGCDEVIKLLNLISFFDLFCEIVILCVNWIIF